MVKFRRSVKGEKPDGKPHHISIPPKDAIAIVPPKKVIKALYDYQAPDPDPHSGYLSFTQGEFLHVVGRENDPDWYEACNPLHNTRGLVPVKYFEPVGKTVRDSGSSTRSAPLTSMPSAGHDSGYAEKTPQSAITEPGPRSARMSKLGKGAGSGAMVYGMVMYDFKAERPDELEAKEGEYIIVIAQSNPEWFVAKPITRLGGSGLIPVSFIEIRDMSTGQAVPDPQDAIQRAGVPKVEEWKKMAADYKNGSIPLGKLEGGAAQLTANMDRLSVQNKSPGYDGNGYNPGHSRNTSAYGQQANFARNSGQNLLAPVSAKVPRYCFADEIFWFVVEAQMKDGRHWELSRLYQDFYDLQINLIQEFPVEAGNVPGVERSLPYMPGPVTYVTDNISNGRRANLDEYIKNLLRLGPHITGSPLVRRFFEPRKGDYEIDPEINPGDYRLSGGSQQSADPHGFSRQSSTGNLSHSQHGYPSSAGYPGHSRTPSQQGQHYRGASDLQVPHGMQRQHSALTQASNSSAGTGSTAPMGGATKIKVWFEQDNCVVLRMPPNFRYADLYRKLRDRRAMERPDDGTNADLAVEYRDEIEGKFYRIENDDDLQIAMERNPKLTLSVTAL